MNKKNWESIIDQLNESGERLRIKMGSPGSAQVTRCRLMSNYDGLDVQTKGSYSAMASTASQYISISIR